MISIPSNIRYLNYKIEVDNRPDNPLFPDDYVLEFSHTYGSNRTYKTVIAEVFKSPDFTGIVTAELFTPLKDSVNTQYQKPALFQQLDNSQNVISVLDHSTEGSYRLLDSTIERLLIRVSQVTPGTGRIMFVVRGL